MDKPKSPCKKDCKYRGVGCNGDSCPYGWAEYERRSIDFAKYVAEKREMHFATRPITEANKQFSHKIVMDKKQKGRT